MSKPQSYEPWPMDYAILRLLPEEGSMLGGVHNMGRRVRDIAAELGEYATVPQVQTRLRVMRENDLVVWKHATGGRVWQRTAKGRAVVEPRPVPQPTELREVSNDA